MYVYGDSSAVSAWKPILDDLVIKRPDITVFPIEDLIVDNGSTLHVGKEVDIIFARRVIIHQTGRIVSEGNLKLDAKSVQGNVA